MAIAFHCGIGVALTLAGWLLARAVAGAWSFRPPAAVALDALAPFGAFLVLFLATGKPVFAGLVPFATFAGFAFADKVKRTTLREPAVFTDMAELRELFRHPDLYLPFAGTGRVLAGAAVAFGFFLIVLLFEPQVLHPSFLQTVIALAAGPFAIFLLMRVWSGPWARMLRRFQPDSSDLFGDAARLGPLAVLLIYGAIARDERVGRRAGLSPRAAAASWRHRPPVILVQCESFFDARRLSPDVPADLIPCFEACRQASLQWGRLEVPCWGANTIRTEFAVLSGLSEAALALDRFNPYHAFARVPVDTLAWTFKAQGYHTVCLHPYDLSFYNRDRIMPLLGFDAFIGTEMFSDAGREGQYVSDAALARHCGKLLEENRGTPLFIFVITMENHGPWLKPATPESSAALVDSLAAVPEAASLGHYLAGLSKSDRMIGELQKLLGPQDGVLGFYGDHLPSFPAAFAHLNFGDIATDYFLWRGGGGPSRRRDIAAQDLSAALLAVLE